MSMEITLDANTMKLSPSDPNAADHVIAKHDVSSVSGVFIADPVRNKSNGHKFDTVTKLHIYLADGREEVIELQEVTNQGTWSDGTKAGLDAAIAAIEAWM